VPVRSEVRLRVRKGSKYSTNPVLLVNLPKSGSTDESDDEERKVAGTGDLGDVSEAKDSIIDSSDKHQKSRYTMT
jgi:hypothetical protein